jgi:hypothetical protein
MILLFSARPKLENRESNINLQTVVWQNCDELRFAVSIIANKKHSSSTSCHSMSALHSLESDMLNNPSFTNLKQFSVFSGSYDTIPRRFPSFNFACVDVEKAIQLHKQEVKPLKTSLQSRSINSEDRKAINEQIKASKQKLIESVKNAMHDIALKNAVSLQELYEHIRSNDFLKNQSERILDANSDEKGKLKALMPAFTASGLFSHRSNAHLAQYSNCIQADIDRFKGEDSKGIKLEDIPKTLERLKQFDFVALTFRSVSRTGIKAILRVEGDASTHADIVDSIEQFFLSEFDLQIDRQATALSQLCYLSHDPEAWLNDDPKTFPHQDYAPKIQKAERIYKTIRKSPLNPKAFIERSFNSDQAENPHYQSYAKTVLQRSLERIGLPSYGERHSTLLRESFLMGGYCAGGYLNPSETLNLLKTYGIDFLRDPEDSERAIEDGFEAGSFYPLHPPNDQERIENLVSELNERFGLIRIESRNAIVVFNSYRQKAAHDTEEKKIGYSFVELKQKEEEMHPEKFVFYDQGADEKIPKPASVFKLWLHHKNRLFFDALTFDPKENKSIIEVKTRTETHKVLNLWNPNKFDRPDKVALPNAFKNLLYWRICSGNENQFNYLLDYMAHAVQKPYELPKTAIVMRTSAHSTGKSAFATIFGRLFGSNHFRHLTDSKQLVGSFNGLMEGSIVLFCDEALFAGDKKVIDMLKGFISEPSLIIEKKFKDAYQIQNYVRLIIASNHDNPVGIEAKDRRYFVPDVKDEKYDGTTLRMEMGWEDGSYTGYKKLYWYLKERDISDFDPANIPDSKSRQQIKALNLDPTTRWIKNLVVDGYALVNPKDDFEKIRIKDASATENDKDKVLESIVNFCTPSEKAHFNKTVITKSLRRFGVAVKRETAGDRKRLYVFPSRYELIKLLIDETGIDASSELVL